MKTQNIYIGTSAKKGIASFKFKDGEFIENNIKDEEFKRFEKSTYLKLTKKYLYSVVEKENGLVIKYRKKDLKYEEKHSTYGKGPCHIEVNKKNNLLFVSNYIDGSYTIFEINKNGNMGNTIVHKTENKKKSHTHCIKVSSNNKFFCIADLGADLLIAYQIKNNLIKEVSRLKFKNNTQPRHIVICKNKIYLITEKSCKLYIIRLKNKKLEILDEKALLPENAELRDYYTGCAIKATRNFKYIYTTIRGHNSISVFKVKKDGLEMIQNIYSGGDLPWDLEIDKNENYVFVANNNSNRVSIFKRNKKNGKLEYKNSKEIESPNCVSSDR